MNSIIRFKSLSVSRNLFKVKFTSSTFADAFKDREKIEEKLYIDKHERELMKKLLSKLQTQGEIEKPQHADQDADALQHVLNRHHKIISKELFNDLLKWKKEEN